MKIIWKFYPKLSTVSDPISPTLDFFPTFCDIAGSEHPENLDRISFLPTIINKGKQDDPGNFLKEEGNRQ